MKSLIILIVSFFLICSCSKNNNSGQEIIAGKWELREFIGGYGPVKHAPGNGNTIEFDNKNEFQIISAAVIVKQGTYELRKALPSADFILKLQYQYINQLQTDNDSVQITDNQLIFLPASSCCDMPASYYERIN